MHIQRKEFAMGPCAFRAFQWAHPSSRVKRRAVCVGSANEVKRFPGHWAAIALSASLLAGCATGKAVTQAPSSGGEMQRYALTGKVVAVNVTNHKVTIAHEDIPGYMEGMTMPFTLLDEAKLRDVKRGDGVKATLVFDEQTNRSWLEDFVVTETNAAGRPAAAQ